MAIWYNYIYIYIYCFFGRCWCKKSFSTNTCASLFTWVKLLEHPGTLLL